MFKSVISTAAIAALTLSLGTLVGSVHAQSSPVKYKITDLGKLDGYNSISVSSINNAGVLLGHSGNLDSEGDGPRAPFIYQDGKFQIFDVLPGYQILSDEGGSINDAGQLVDTVYQLTGGDEVTSMHAFLRQADGQLLDINPQTDNVYTEARSINNKGQIAGTKFDESGKISTATGFFFSDGAFQDLNISLPGDRDDIEVTGVNDNGQVIGTAFPSKDRVNPQAHAFLYNNNGQTIDLGASLKEQSEAKGINNKGDVIINTSRKGYVYRNGQLQELPALSGETDVAAAAINDSGDIVGVSDYTDGFINKNGESFSLLSVIDNQDQWVELEPTSINNNGVIAGVGFAKVGDGNNLDTHAFLLTPIIEKK